MPSNKEFLNALAKDDPEKLTEWMDAEHSAIDVDALIAENAKLKDKFDQAVESYLDAKEERDAWKAKFEELEKENNALLDAHADDVERLDALGEAEVFELHEEIEELYSQLENAHAAHYELREKLGAACDHAHGILALMDLENTGP
jgi:predicted nuclease with TOPRIM domain